MTTLGDATFELFRRAALSDSDLGYPDRTEFVPGDLPNADEVVWRSIRDDRRPVVVVLDDFELLLAPRPYFWPLRLFDRLRGQVRVQVHLRRHGEQLAVTTHVGHHTLTDMRRPLARSG